MNITELGLNGNLTTKSCLIAIRLNMAVSKGSNTGNKIGFHSKNLVGATDHDLLTYTFLQERLWCLLQSKIFRNMNKTKLRRLLSLLYHNYNLIH